MTVVALVRARSNLLGERRRPEDAVLEEQVGDVFLEHRVNLHRARQQR